MDSPIRTDANGTGWDGMPIQQQAMGFWSVLDKAANSEPFPLNQ
jgi:hypothetical protein